MSHSPGSEELIESNSVGQVDPANRHGRVRDLFTLWFSTNIAPLPIVTGAMSIQVFDLSLVWAICAIVVGHMIGGIVLGLASAQGPQLGLPQMLQSRGQFGRYGALLVVVIAAILYVGFFISNCVLAGKSIHTMVPAMPLEGAILTGACAATLIGILGYNFIHTLNRLGTWVMGFGLLGGFVFLFINGLPEGFASRGGFNIAGWLAMASLGAIWQMSFAPYTSDYSRYLPEDVGIWKPFIATYSGAVLGTSLCFIFGTLVALTVAPDADIMGAVKGATGEFGPVLMVLFILSIISHNALNLYGAVLALITSVQTFAADWTPSRRARVVLSGVLLIACCAVAVTAPADFIAKFMKLILAMMIVLVPWATLNLMDFYIVQRMRYHVPSLFAQDGGIYGRYNPNAVTAYLIGIIVQLPFISTPIYTGPVVAYLDGADLSWLVCIIVTAPLYWLLARRDTPYRRQQISTLSRWASAN
ncbi:purine-cytosine permease family protein [Pseudomonas matsuisoli]|uniref:Cytosine permease n=1 Tax=Pseudomonas matsuisoli TaxID=1515666 RepID=A0A917UZK6_9PSED|nr:cytosine permease [Pseudomonas matsuisoli]GGK01414.1 cytosine permease [Pseudomonas matsuisoli]